jgi:hypothetical protein
MSPDTHIPNNLDATLEEHKRLRPLLAYLHAEILQTLLQKEDALICAKRLGMIHTQQGVNTVRIGHPLEAALLSDYQIYMHRPQGINAVQRQLLRNRYPKESDEYRMLEAMTQARFSVFVIKSVVPDTGFTCIDLYSGQELFIMDPTLAQQDSVGLMTGLRIFPFDDFRMYTGVNIPMGMAANIEEIKPLGALQTVKEEQELNDSVIIKWREMIVGMAGGETTAA